MQTTRVLGVTPINPNKGPSGPGPSGTQQSLPTKHSLTDGATEAMDEVIADADGFNEILNELFQVHKHMAMILKRIKQSTEQLSQEEVQQQDIERQLNELKSKKMGLIEGKLNRLLAVHKDIRKDIEQFSQNINITSDPACD